MPKRIIKDKVFNWGTGYPPFEIQHESSCSFIPNRFSITVYVDTVPIHLMLEKLVNSWLIAMNFGAFEVEVFKSLF
jgi:hypothetical protein